MSLDTVPASYIKEFTALTCDKTCHRCNNNVCIVTDTFSPGEVITVDRGINEDGIITRNMICFFMPERNITVNFPVAITRRVIEYFSRLIDEKTMDRELESITIVRQCSKDGTRLTKHSKIRVLYLAS